MHRLVLPPTEPPRKAFRRARVQVRQRRERIHYIADQAPTHFQAFDSVAVPHILRQHNHDLALQKMRMPRHLQTRCHVFRTLDKLLVACVVILDVKQIHALYASHSAWENQATILICTEITPLCFGCIPRQTRRPIDVPAWTSD